MATWQLVLLIVIGVFGLILGVAGWIIDIVQVVDAVGRRRERGAGPDDKSESKLN